MEDESGIDIFTGAIRYPFTDGARLFVGGLAGLLFFVLIGIPFMLGYQVRCGRKILDGDNDLPGWEDIDSLFVDGIKAAIITLLYGVVTVIVVYGMLIILVIAGSGLNDNVMLLYLVVVMIATLIVALPLSMIGQIALLMYSLFIWVKFFVRVVDGNREASGDDYQWLNQI